MLEITMRQDGNTTYIALEGQLDTLTAPLLDERSSGIPDDTTCICMEMEKIKYVSSAGLRVILMLAKRMISVGGKLVMKNVDPVTEETLDYTGLADFIDFE